ncbi:MAG: NAD(P)/FAD-dependent oxidoreductase [Thermoanaerobaculia bacterium]
MSAPDHLPDYDAIVVGAGPAGSTCAHLLARAGKKVLVLEKDAFPRFRIGESLLPYSTPIFARLGVLDELKSKYQHKYGAYFSEEGKEGSRKVVFAHGLTPGYGLAFQAKRAELDQMLIDAAARAGAEIRFQWKVTAFQKQDGRIEGVLARSPSGETRRISSRVVVDATGRQALGARGEGAAVPEDKLRRGALFAHYRNVPRGPEESEGDIRMVIFDKGWWWFIPFSDSTWSIGVVSGEMPAGASLEDRFDALVASTPTVHTRLSRSERITPVMAESDYSYSVRSIVANGYLAIGDAAGFLDPIFSSGVFLAMSTGEKAADEICRILSRRPTVRAADLKRYEKFAMRGFKEFRKYVVGFYNPGFRDLFYQRPPLRPLYTAVTSVLAGGVFARNLPLRFWSRTFLFFVGREMRRRAAETLP